MKILILAITSLLTSWQFAKEQNDHQMPVAEDKNWQEVTVPHDWAIYGPFDRANDLQNVTVWQNGETFPSIKTGRTGGLPYMGSAWYKTILPLQGELEGAYFLLFDGAMSEAEVFVNGQKVCFWPYGYNAFHCDITKALQEGENEIAVRLQNREQSSRWYPGAGLFRNVHLIQKPQVYVPIWGTHITTPYVTEELAAVNIKTTVANALNKHIELRTSLIHKATGEVVDSLISHYDVKHNLPLEQNITINNPALWSPETPNLYIARTCVVADSVYQETVETTFGVRSVQIVPNVGFLLNGKVRKIQGVCLHHDLGPLGSAVSRDALRRQLLMLKEMGCDAIRTSHNMPAPEQIELCDELGLMVMCEPFDEWDWAKCKNGYSRFFNEWAERDMVNMLHHFRNNPSVVMWSIGNEVPTQCDPQGYKTAKMLQDICVREDGTRPCTAGMDQVT
ncbi:MAG: beta-galactosidase, partial [Paludibacteraceae bacterium]|nr:beta-galactosidase [Paludibacteraceae bacterium]